MNAGPEINENNSSTARSKDSERLRAVLTSHHDDLRDIAAKYRAHDIHIFGSVARGDAEAGSDIDLLVSIDGPDYEQLMSTLGMADELTERLGVRVDVVARGIAPNLADVTPTVEISL